MRTISVPAFCSEFGFTQIEKTFNQNTNGYPFVQFYNNSNECTCIYFSKSAGVGIKKGASCDPAWLAENFTVSIYLNGDNEQRIKISGKGESRRINLADFWG